MIQRLTDSNGKKKTMPKNSYQLQQFAAVALDFGNCGFGVSEAETRTPISWDRHFTKRSWDELKSSSKLSDANEDFYETFFQFSFGSFRPLKTLPKQYHPLPPEPKISSNVLHTRETPSQPHTFPISSKPTRHLSFRDLNEVSGRDKGTGNKLEFILQEQKYKAKHLPEASFQYMQSSKNMCSSGSMVNAESVSVKRSPSPIHYTTCENKPKHSLLKEKVEYIAQPTEQDLHKYEWYVGEYDRHEAEAALLEENTDETFLVRDCSKKSNTEPYVLVVYYGRRVYNIKVRFLEDSQQYALGTGLRGDDKFNSVKDIIDFYKYIPITLIDGKDKTGIQRVQCYLTHPLKLHKTYPTLTSPTFE
ncbi:LOW QUALITY PROTEIN: cytokine-dependent hematopoietic cell linker [Coturnix japonica]|uniref:LOW QUALITY PROTEIN: cytokine-dependent hematopoietic cell linker n=1 Tax=Coturnix japonica TaxID=93934 RepID=UPI0013A5E053|nr:LOW QUALITY PROTEIN: cytokine-dependent hematopoietic cell linker [Coturnix japonica]